MGSVGLTDCSPGGEVADFLTQDSLPHETIGFHPPRPRSTTAPGRAWWDISFGPTAARTCRPTHHRGLRKWACTQPLSPSSFMGAGLRKGQLSRLPCLLDVLVAYGKRLGSVCPHRMQSASVPHQQDAHIPRGFDVRPTAVCPGRTSLAAHVRQCPNNCTRPYVQRPCGENSSLSGAAAPPVSGCGRRISEL